jgi:hypothetical protein
MIPPLNLTIRARGASPSAVLFNHVPMSYEFSSEPESESFDPQAQEAVFIEGAMTNVQPMDCVRHVYLGKNPYSIKMSTRCYAMTVAQTSPTAKAWDRRWMKQCPCGGNWTLKCLEK